MIEQLIPAIKQRMMSLFVMVLVGWFACRPHCTLGTVSYKARIGSPPVLGRSIHGSFWRAVAVLSHPPKLCRLLPNAPLFPSTRPVPASERISVWRRHYDRSEFRVPIWYREPRCVLAPACGRDQQARVCLLLAGCLFLGCSWVFGYHVVHSIEFHIDANSPQNPHCLGVSCDRLIATCDSPQAAHRCSPMLMLSDSQRSSRK